MKHYIVFFCLLTTSCVIPRNAENRCMAAGLTVDSLKITEYPDQTQYVKAECIKRSFKFD